MFLGLGLLFWRFEFRTPPILLVVTMATCLVIITSGRNRLAQEQKLATGQEPDLAGAVTKPPV